MERILITPGGHASLLKQKEDITAKLRAAQFKKGKAAANDTNTWHDNAEFDIYKQEEMLLTEQLAEVVRKIENATLVAVSEDRSVLGIGHIAVLRSEDDTEKTYVVGGFGETDLAASPQKVAYDAPLMRGFVGQGVGHAASVMVKGESVMFTLLEIQ